MALCFRPPPFHRHWPLPLGLHSRCSSQRPPFACPRSVGNTGVFQFRLRSTFPPPATLLLLTLRRAPSLLLQSQEPLTSCVPMLLHRKRLNLAPRELFTSWTAVHERFANRSRMPLCVTFAVVIIHESDHETELVIREGGCECASDLSRITIPRAETCLMR
jgi:hypothetical protein